MVTVERSDPALRDLFVEAMSHAASTVNVVTSDGPAGRAGVTVSAMTSVSADSERPSLLVCIHHRSRACRAILENGVFCVNVLKGDQSEVADIFAGRAAPRHGDRFDCAQWTQAETGAPLLADALVAFDCELKESVRHGTHHIFIGEVADIVIADPGPPLLYANRAYGRPVRLHGGEKDAGARGDAPPAAHDRLRRFNTRDTYPDQALDNDLCQVVRARGTMVFVRGQVGQDLETAETVGAGDPAAQAEQAMRNVKALLEEAGSALEHICRVQIFITDRAHREPVYRVVGKWLKGVYPVSTGLIVQGLARPDWLMEIEVTAVIPEDGD
mgnify:CR=1 FL=1